MNAGPLSSILAAKKRAAGCSGCARNIQESLEEATCFSLSNYTSIDPKQRQHLFGVGVNSENSNVGGNECKYTFLKPPAVWELHLNNLLPLSGIYCSHFLALEIFPGLFSF